MNPHFLSSANNQCCYTLLQAINDCGLLVKYFVVQYFFPSWDGKRLNFIWFFNLCTKRINISCIPSTDTNFQILKVQ